MKTIHLASILVLTSACSSADLTVAPVLLQDTGMSTDAGADVATSETILGDLHDARADGADAVSSVDADAGADVVTLDAAAETDGGCLLIDDGMSNDGTLHPCWPGYWTSFGSVNPPSITMSPALGAAWPSTTLPDGGKGRRFYGTLATSAELMGIITFASPTDLSAYTSFVITLQIGPTETGNRSYEIFVRDSEGHASVVTAPLTHGADPLDVVVALTGSATDPVSITEINVQVTHTDNPNWDVYIARPRVEK
ncbi:MAG: hypothetical protein ACHREM_01050 [Polyangiales bacterium]